MERYYALQVWIIQLAIAHDIVRMGDLPIADRSLARRVFASLVARDILVPQLTGGYRLCADLREIAEFVRRYAAGAILKALLEQPDTLSGLADRFMEDPVFVLIAFEPILLNFMLRLQRRGLVYRAADGRWVPSEVLRGKI